METQSSTNQPQKSHSPTVNRKKEQKFKKKLLDEKNYLHIHKPDPMSGKGTPIGTTKSCNIKSKNHEKHQLKDSCNIPKTSTNKDSQRSMKDGKTPNSLPGYTFFKISNDKGQ